MTHLGPLIAVAVLMVGSLVLLLTLLVGSRQSRLSTRLQGLAARGGTAGPVDPLVGLAQKALPVMGTAFLPRSQEERTRLQTRLIHAGYYSRQAMVLFLGVKMVLMIAPPLLGAFLGLSGVVTVQKGVIVGCLVGAFGMIAPSFWLDKRTANRKVSFRRALPDAMDVLVICLEGGSSLPAALRRVAGELRTAHSVLARELEIVQQEMQLGRSVSDALRQFADRSDLEEIRNLAALVGQAERFGASLVKSLRVHAEVLRQKRLQQAEEMAQKAAVKMLFPTILFIMPAMFIVVLGPTSIAVLETFRGIR
jgi:tight adherence protein C